MVHCFFAFLINFNKIERDYYRLNASLRLTASSFYLIQVAHDKLMVNHCCSCAGLSVFHFLNWVWFENVFVVIVFILYFSLGSQKNLKAMCLFLFLLFWVCYCLNFVFVCLFIFHTHPAGCLTQTVGQSVSLLMFCFFSSSLFPSQSLCHEHYHLTKAESFNTSLHASACKHAATN